MDGIVNPPTPPQTMNDEPAFPLSVATTLEGSLVSSDDIKGGAGLTKREWMTGMALEAVLKSDPQKNLGADEVARTAINIADSVFEQLSKK